MPPEALLEQLPPQTGLRQQDGIPGIPLWLLEVDTHIQMNAAEIQHWWSAMPYWAFAWAGGRAQAQWILKHPGSVQGKHVLDFGCGSGLVAIAASKSGAKSVCAVDIDPAALLAARHNAMLNQVDIQVSHDWRSFSADCFFASDILYDPASHGALLELMNHCSSGWLAEPTNLVPDTLKSSVAIQAAKIQIGNAAAKTCSFTLPEIADFDRAVDVEILPVFKSINEC